VTEEVDGPAHEPSGKEFSYDGLFWRRLARFGAAHGPDWWVKYSPPAIGALAAMALPAKRRAVQDNLRRIRGPVNVLKDAAQVTRTFATYAGCFAEGLTNGSKNAAIPDVAVNGRPNMEAAIAEGKGVIVVTAHTAGWENAGAVLRFHKGLDVVMVMEAERDGAARALHDDVRRSSGLSVAHVGRDPFSSLPLLHRLRDGACIALQIDRMPAGMRGVPVRIFDEPGEIPEGPLRLSQVSGAPIVPTFSARLGYRRYFTKMYPAVHIARRPTDDELRAAAQMLADAMQQFVREHPTQWFHFG
jgi:phosphatidylinositol dimannoside acyltransferase